MPRVRVADVLNNTPFSFDSDPRYWLQTEIPWEDRLLREGVTNFERYTELEQHLKIGAALEQRYSAALSPEAKIIPGGDRRQDRKNAEWIEETFLGIAERFGLDEKDTTSTVGINAVCEILLRSVFAGVSAAAVIWQRKGRHFQVSDFIEIPQRRIRFGRLQDAPKNVQTYKGYGLRLISKEDPYRGTWVTAPYRVLIHSWGSRESNPYGRGLASGMWMPYCVQKATLKAWAISAHRASATVLVKLPPGVTTPDHPTYKATQDFLDVFAPDNYLMVPHDVDVSYLESQRADRGVHQELVDYFDSLFSQVITGQTGLLSQDGSGGSRARDEVAERVGTRISKRDSDALSTGPLAKLCEWMTELGPYPQARPPSIWREFEKVESLDARATRDKLLSDATARPLDLAYVSATYGTQFAEAPTPVLIGGDGDAGGDFAFAAIATDETIARRQQNWEATRGAPYVQVVRVRNAVSPRATHAELEGQVFPNDRDFWRRHCFPSAPNCGHDLIPIGFGYDGAVSDLPRDLLGDSPEWENLNPTLRQQFVLEGD